MNKETQTSQRPVMAADRIMTHFSGLQVSDLVTVEKVFPTTIQPDLESAIEVILEVDQGKAVFCGISGAPRYQTTSFSYIVTERREPPIISAAEYMDIDIGEETSGRCITCGIWFFHVDGAPAALLVSQLGRIDNTPGVRTEVIASEAAGGHEGAQAILARLAQRLSSSSVYRGKALSFETSRSYYGGLGALKVHRLAKTTLDQVILPKTTLDALQRTVFGFVKARGVLAEKGFSTKRGLLLYGPPGTGKTHFIRYLISQLEGHTSLLVTAEQVAAFDEIMGIARALQPSVVVIEDADLLARSRDLREGDCSQMLLNSLLNHMDGLTDDAEIMFILTTNRPESLEEAVRDRPGRIDQAIEIPRPDPECRARLLDLYRGKMVVPDEVIRDCVLRTDGASAAFMRELARRMAQFAILRDTDRISSSDMTAAFEEMLGAGAFTAGALGAEELLDG